MMRSDPLLSILIVNWNTSESLANCLHHISEAVDGLPFQAIVVDNDSSDGSLQMLRQEFAWVTCIPVKRNLGYGAGMNLAIRRARAPYVLLLNPDVVPQRGSITTLVSHLRGHPGIAIVGGYLYGGDGRSQMEDYYVPFPTLPAAMLHYTRWSGLARRFHLTPHRFTDKTVRQVPGACLLTRREVLAEVGPFDEEFFVWFEDVDWCYRAVRNQFGLGICEKAAFLHEGGKSFEAVSVETRKKWYYRSMLRFFRKHKGWFSWATLVGTILTEEALVMTVSGAIGLVWVPSRKTMLARSTRARGFISFLVKETRSAPAPAPPPEGVRGSGNS
jgi:GT2 family glycosyltransferase